VEGSQNCRSVAQYVYTFNSAFLHKVLEGHRCQLAIHVGSSGQGSSKLNAYLYVNQKETTQKLDESNESDGSDGPDANSYEQVDEETTRVRTGTQEVSSGTFLASFTSLLLQAKQRIEKEDKCKNSKKHWPLKIFITNDVTLLKVHQDSNGTRQIYFEDEIQNIEGTASTFGMMIARISPIIESKVGSAGSLKWLDTEMKKKRSDWNEWRTPSVKGLKTETTNKSFLN